MHNFENPAIFYVGWGPQGGDKAMALLGEIAMDRPHMDHTALHVQDGQVRSQEVGIDERWGNWLPLREPSMDVIMELGLPYTSRQALQAAYEPLKQPTFGYLEASTREIYSQLPPSMRAKIADRFLDQLSSAEKLGATSWQTHLAHLITQDTPVRDHIVVRGLQEPTKADALLRLYRGVPPELQGPLGTIAATALLGHDVHRVGSAHIIDQLHRYPRGLGNCQNLHSLVSQVQIHGLNPEPVVDHLKSLDQTSELVSADATWVRAQAVDAATTVFKPSRLPDQNVPVDLSSRNSERKPLRHQPDTELNPKRSL